MNRREAAYQVTAQGFKRVMQRWKQRFLRITGPMALAVVFVILLERTASPQNVLPVQWESLSSADFVKAIAQAQGTCLLPFGILEKHGQQLPLGTDLLNVRYAAINAAHKEYVVVFPAYYFGQIFEARHEPGTVAYSAS